MPPSSKIKASASLTPVTEINLKAMSSIRDDKDTMISTYFSVNSPSSKDDRSFVSGRMKAIAKALPEDLRGDYAKTAGMVEPFIASANMKGERGRIIFASAGIGVIQVFRVGVDLEPMVVLDRSPFLLPLARLRDNYQDYGLLLLDSQEARLFFIRSDFLQEKKKISIDLMNKHKKGGWSQMRYNRLRMGSIKSFLSQVIDDLQKWEDLSKAKGLVVAGPGEAKEQFAEMLPPDLKKMVLDVVSVSMETSSGDLVKLGDEIARGDRAMKEAMAEKLKDRVLKGQLAAYGLDEVGGALKQGRVNFLLISKGFALPGMICKSCHHIHAQGERCHTCGARWRLRGGIVSLNGRAFWGKSSTGGGRIPGEHRECGGALKVLANYSYS